MPDMPGQFERDVSNRLCFELFSVDAVAYPKIVSQIVQQFCQQPTLGLVVGSNQLIGSYSDSKCSIALDWDNWSGFFVTANSPDAESLARQIGAIISEEEQVCFWRHGNFVRAVFSILREVSLSHPLGFVPACFPLFHLRHRPSSRRWLYAQ